MVQAETLSQSGPYFPSPPPWPSYFLFLLLLFTTASGQHHNRWSHHSVRYKSATSDAPSTQIRQACKATRFPNVYESTLFVSDSLPPNPSPSDFILATANASAASLQTARSMIQSILDVFKKASNINRTNTVHICLEVLSYSDRHLSVAFSLALPIGALDDARVWASDARVYQYDCWFSLKYVNGTVQVADAMAFIFQMWSNRYPLFKQATFVRS